MAGDIFTGKMCETQKILRRGLASALLLLLYINSYQTFFFFLCINSRVTTLPSAYQINGVLCMGIGYAFYLLLPSQYAYNVYLANILLQLKFNAMADSKGDAKKNWNGMEKEKYVDFCSIR